MIRQTLNALFAIGVLAAVVIGAASAHGQPVTPISALPAATTPLSRTELVPMVQGGVTKQTPVSSIFDPASPGALGTFTPNTAQFTNLTVLGTVTGNGFTDLFASPPPIGLTLPGAADFTALQSSSLTVTGGVSGAGFTAFVSAAFAVPPPLGTTTPNLVDGTTVSATAEFDLGTKMLCSATLPTLTGSGFGGSPAVVASHACAMAITVGTSPSAATGTIQLPAAPHGWVCTGNDTTTQSTTVAQLKQVAGGSTTSAVIQNFTDVMGAGTSWTAGDVLLVHCTPY